MIYLDRSQRGDSETVEFGAVECGNTLLIEYLVIHDESPLFVFYFYFY